MLRQMRGTVGLFLTISGVLDCVESPLSRRRFLDSPQRRAPGEAFHVLRLCTGRDVFNSSVKDIHMNIKPVKFVLLHAALLPYTVPFRYEGVPVLQPPSCAVLYENPGSNASISHHCPIPLSWEWRAEH